MSNNHPKHVLPYYDTSDSDTSTAALRAQSPELTTYPLSRGRSFWDHRRQAAGQPPAVAAGGPILPVNPLHQYRTINSLRAARNSFFPAPEVVENGDPELSVRDSRCVCVEILGHEFAEPSLSVKMPMTDPGSLRKLLKDGPFSDIQAGKYSDFKVKVSNKTFNLHRASVIPQCPFFRAALQPGGFIESKTLEVNLPEDDPRGFDLFVQLVYLGELAEESIKTMDYAKLYMMADKYGGSEVIKVAFDLARCAISIIFSKLCLKKELKKELKVDPKVDSKDAGLGETVDQEMKKNWDVFTACIDFIWSNIPSSSDKLKAAIAKDAATKWRRLFVNPVEVKDFLNTNPEFAIEVLSILSGNDQK